MLSPTLRYFVFSLLLWWGGAMTGHGAGSQRQNLPDRVSAVAARMTPLGLLPATDQLHLTLALPLRNQSQLDALIDQLYDPASPNYRQFITPQDFADRFGPTKEDYAALLTFARTNGFQIIGTQPNRMLVDVACSVATAERVFDVTLHTYQHPKENRDFYAPDTEPSVAAPVTLLKVYGLDNYALPHPKSLLKSPLLKSQAAPRSGSGSGGSYLGNDFRAAYVPGTPLTGSGQSVALVQFDGYYASDIASYLSTAGYPSSLTNALVNVPVNGGVSTPGSGNGEVCLDIEMVMSMAPGISKIYVYEGPNGGTSWPTMLSKIANDNLVKQVGCSWGATTAGSPDTTSENIFKQMAAQGISFFNASGDSDAFVGGVPFPSESTNITQVGGTTLSTTGPSGAWSSETAWNWGFVSSQNAYIGTSGGVSGNFGIPVWQQGISMVANHGSTTKRNVPDVALAGDNIYVTYNNGSVGIFGGTSCAAPLWAGFMALVNQQAELAALPPIGFANPAIYAIGKSSDYNNCFHDTATGNNYWSNSLTNYPAVTGFDLCTGWGTPNGTNLINRLAPLVYAPNITGTAWTLVSESAVPANGAVDPGETVTVSFTLRNKGSLATDNLMATLQSDTNILVPDGPQSYGGLAAFGGSSSRSFTFTTADTISCGSNITAELQLQDGTNDLGAIDFSIPLGKNLGLSENFDAMTVPDLPMAWISTNLSGNESDWVTTSTESDSAPNSAFTPDSENIGENALVTPAISISTTTAQLTFRQNYSFEYGITGHGPKTATNYYDGGVLEIQIGNGAFTDIVSAGGSIVSNGYNDNLSASNGNPLAGRSAWVGTSSGWQTVTVNLPSSAAGQTIHLRWNCGTDSGNGGGGTVIGWYVDSIHISDGSPTCLSVFTDISAEQSLAPASQDSGQNLVYTLSITNLGPQAAADVVLTDTVPANATFVSASSGCIYSAGQVFCPAGTLAVGSSTNFTVTLAPTVGDTFTNTINVGTVTPEITQANNQSTLISTQITSSSAPQITLSPVNQTIECGASAEWSITASGTAPLTIQWSFDGTPILDATNLTFSMPDVHLPDHVVTVSVTNLYGGVTSNAVVNVLDTQVPVLTLNGADPLYLELGSTFVDPGATANDVCEGSLPVSVSGAVNANAISTNTLVYSASDSNGNTNSLTRTVIVQDTTPPVISWSFTNLVLAANTNCDGVMPDVTGTNFIIATDLSGAVTISQTPTNNAILLLGTNVVIITVLDDSGNAAYSTNFIFVQDQLPPELVLQPQSQTNYIGSNTTFTVGATACTPVSYQWFFNDKVVADGTNDILTLTNLQSENVGDYFAIATADGGSVTSLVASLSVVLTNDVVGSNNGFILTLNGTPGATYILETTTNLFPADWLPFDTNTIGTNGIWQFTDPQAGEYQQRFFRLHLLQ